MTGMEVEGEPCILCNNLTFRTGENSGGELLLPQLRVIYLVEKVFRKGEWEDRDKLTRALEELGDPVEWFDLCDKCEVEVDRGIQLWRRLKRAEAEHERGLRRLKERVVKDVGSEEGRGREKEGMRRWLKGERGEGNLVTEDDGFPEVKEEPVEDDQDDWAPHEFLELEENHGFEEDQLPLEEMEVKTEKVVRVKQKTGTRRRKKMSKRDRRKMRANILKQYMSSMSRGPKVPPLPSVEDEEKKDCKNDLESEMNITREKDEVKDDKNNLELEIMMTTREKRKCTQRSSGGVQGEVAPVDQDDDEEEGGPSTKKRRSRLSDDEDFDLFEESLDLDSSEIEDLDIDYPPKNVNRVSEEDPVMKEFRQQFNSKVAEYLDNTIIVYPPVTPEDLDKIPKSGAPKVKEDGQSHNGAHKCPRCPKRFSQIPFAIAHILQIHLRIRKVWKCPHCPNHSVARVRRLRKHMYAHYQGIIKNCKVCGIYCRKTKNGMDAHIIDHQKGVERPQCPDCSEIFKEWTDYVNHMTQLHGYSYLEKSQSDDQICELCGKTVHGIKKNLEYHRVKTHGEDNGGRFPVCEICGQVCRQEYDLKKHVECRHGQEDEQWFCEFCGKKCINKASLEKHVKFWHVDKPDVCRVCGLEQTNKERLAMHMNKSHSEVKKMSEEEIAEYRRRKEEQMGYSCAICGQKFAWSVLLYYHLRRSHPEKMDKFKCDLCGKGFSRNCSLKRHHQSEHEGKRVYCQACGKPFKGRDGLTQHLRKGYCESLKKAGENAEGGNCNFKI